MSNEIDDIPRPHRLSKKPLVEAIFELRWGLQQLPGGDGVVDPGFQILLGRFYDKVSSDFPEVENLPASIVPEPMVPSVVRHRLRRAKDDWPLIQLGPGVLSVNDTETYSWDSFKPMLRKAVEALLQAYPEKIAPLALAQATLRYINAVPLNQGSKTGVLQFLEDYLHTTVRTDPRLFDDPKIAEDPIGLNLRFNYPLGKPLGVGVLSFTTGMRENVPSVIWENIVISKGDHVPTTLDAFDAWFNEAHTITDRWFFTLCRGELLTSFGGDNAH